MFDEHSSQDDKPDTQPKSKQMVAAGFELSKDVARDVFRYLFSKENSLIELYPNPILVKLSDLADLHRQINQKIQHYDVYGAQFDAVATYENNKSEQYNSWERFFGDDWGTADVIDQLLLNWRFMIKFPKIDKPASYVVSVRLAASLKPQHVIQALFSKNPEDVDRIEMDLVPMSCRVDFVDPLLSEELMNIVSAWNKSRPAPEYIFPSMKRIRRHADKIATTIRYSIPILSFAACIAYYWMRNRALDFTKPASAELVIQSNLWFAATVAVVFFTSVLGYASSQYVQKQLKRFGNFTIFSLTKGDEKRQNELMARSTNSFWKFIASGSAAVLWNIIAALLCAIFLKTK